MTLIDEVRSARTLPPPSTARLIRQAAGVSQTRMARELEVSRATLSRWEAGRVRPREAQRIRWAGLLDALQRELAS